MDLIYKDKLWPSLFNDNILSISKGDEQLAKRRQKLTKQDRAKLRRIEEPEGMTACPEVSTSNYHSDESSSYNQSPPTDQILQELYLFFMHVKMIMNAYLGKLREINKNFDIQKA